MSTRLVILEMALGTPLGNGKGVVGGPVVDHDDIGEPRAHLGYHRLQDLCLVEGRNDHERSGLDFRCEGLRRFGSWNCSRSQTFWYSMGSLSLA